MMCDTTNRSFRTRLAAILDKLTKAALVEIGNLADECSAVLHTEMSLHKTENEALKKRCYSLEVQLRAAREAQTYPVNNRRHHAGQEDRRRGQFGWAGASCCLCSSSLATSPTSQSTDLMSPYASKAFYTQFSIKKKIDH